MTERDLGKAVVPRVDEARLARQWSAIEPHLQVRPGVRWSRWLPALGAGLSAIAVVLFLFLTPAEQPSAWDGAMLETRAEPTAVTLKDGSRIELSGQTRVEVVKRQAEAVELRVLRGSARFDVAKDPSRLFSVLADGVTVRVIGTKFSVGVEEGEGDRKVTVVVERGVVECTSGDQRIELRAGQSWSSASESVAAKESDDEVAEPQPEREPAADLAPEPALAAPRPSVAPLPLEPARTARQLFEEANAARMSGDFASAAEGYRALLAAYPSDSRAGLAAFELGRLLQDRFGDPAGAARALGRAIRASTGAGFKEDALARLVRAYATMGARDECERARGAYLGSYPSGVHRKAVERACGHGG